MIRLSNLLIAACCVAGSAHAETCNDQVAATSPQSRFVILDDGTASDLRTGLKWRRCPIGYEVNVRGTPGLFSDDSCDEVDEADHTWAEALATAGQLNQSGGFAGHTDWRVPNVKELLSIVERRCASPAINSIVFPEAAPLRPAIYWSSSSSDDTLAYVLDYTEGLLSTNFGNKTTNANLVRLVR